MILKTYLYDGQNLSEFKNRLKIYVYMCSDDDKAKVPMTTFKPKQKYAKFEVKA